MKRNVAILCSLAALGAAGCGSSSKTSTASKAPATPGTTGKTVTGPSGRGAAGIGTPIADPQYVLYLSNLVAQQEHTNPGIGNIVAHCIIAKLQAQGVKTSQAASYNNVQPAMQACFKQVLHK